MISAGLGTGLAWFQLVFGVVCLVFSFRGSPVVRYWGPVGLLSILAAAARFGDGHVSDTTLVTLSVLSFAGIGVWCLRVHRAFKAHLRELGHKRDQAMS